VKRIEVRRHSHRNPGESSLSSQGVELARQVGRGLGPFARVVSSPASRARETATAMGFEVDAVVEELLPDMSSLWTNDDYAAAATVADYADALAARPGLRALGAAQARLWLGLLQDLPDDSALLAISHGGVIEFGTLGVLPNGPQRAWGPCFGLCEGVSVSVDGGKVLSVATRRVRP